MAEPSTVRSDVDEAQEAFRSFIIACNDPSSILELVETPFDQIAQGILGMIHADAHLAGFAHWNLRQNIPFIHVFSNSVSIITPVRQKDVGLAQVIRHDQIKAEVVGCLARGDPSSHGQTCCVNPEVDLGREATS